MKESNTVRRVLGGLLGAFLGLGVLAGSAGAAEFEVVADSFTAANQVNLSSAVYMKGMPTTGPGRPADPDTATSYIDGGGLYFDSTSKTYKVWDTNANAWVNVATGTLAGSPVSGSGTLNKVPKWTPDGSTLGDSSITDDGTTVTVAPSGGVTVTPALTASNGVTVSAGGATVTAGGVTVNGGGVSVTAGNLTMTGTGTADILGFQVTKSGNITTLRNGSGVALVNIK